MIEERSSSVLAFRAPAQRSRGGGSAASALAGRLRTGGARRDDRLTGCSPGESGVASLAAGRLIGPVHNVVIWRSGVP